MDFKTLYDGTKVPSIGLGTWLIGGALQPDYSADAEAVRILRVALEMGYTFIDTAELYGAGHCEELIGQAIRGLDRSKLFIVSKVKDHLQYADVLSSAEGSLQRLGVEYIDLYLIHAPVPHIPLEETMKAMNELVDAGKVKYIGVSAFALDTLKRAQLLSRHRIAAHQLEYSLLTRNKGKYGDIQNMESEVIPYCQEHDMLVMAVRPIERGFLVSSDNPVLHAICRKYDKTAAQVALNWLICKKNIMAIPKSANEKHLKENLGALGWQLSAEDIKKLDETKFTS